MPGASQVAAPLRSLPAHINMPYCGSYRGALWNAQALFSRQPSKHEKKMNKVVELMRHQDFMFISETHSTIGKVRALEHRLEQLGLSAWWSHGGHRRAGTGVIIKNSFLSEFSSAPPTWLDISPGEAGILRLSGSKGQLDLCAAYFPTGNQRSEGNSLVDLRSALRRKIHGAVRPQQITLTIMGADFNYVTDRDDRWSKNTARWSSTSDHRDELDWGNLFGGREGILNELYQPHGTHDSAGARSRLDRVYVSSGIAEQLDAQLGCATLDWCKDLSNHRPLIFFSED